MQINIIEYLEETISRTPERVAIIDANDRISFSDLAMRSKALAEEIVLRTGGGYNAPIGVFISKSIMSVVSDMAATYSGNIYMNIDQKTPTLRVNSIIDTIKPALIITDTAGMTKLAECHCAVPLLNFDEFDRTVPRDEEALLKRLDAVIDTDPYCIINTSGSTGTPKGVVLNHKSFIDYVEWALNTFNFPEETIVGSLSPNVFDHSNYKLCLMIAKGATLVFLPHQYSAFPIKLLEIIKQERINYIFWVPSIMVNIANMDLLSTIELPDLRLVWFAGEVFPTKQFNYWHKALPQVTFANLYGPTEITVDCTYYIVNRSLNDNEPIPIGFPCRNTDILILKDDNTPAVNGEEGELCVRGTSLAMGYYNNPEKTAAAFTQNPLNNSYPETIYRTGDIVYKNELGEIIYKGRRDSLIKHMGYRIELGEIEHVVVNTLKIADNACVVYNFAKKEITLIYESKEEKDIAQMRRKIGEAFPKYMIPTAFIKMEELPRNMNGKIDRLKLSKGVNEE